MEEFWFCCIGPGTPSRYRGNGADTPLRGAVKSTFAAMFGAEAECSSGWGVSEEQAAHISFASLNDADKAETVRSYRREGKPLPRHVRAWELLLQETGASTECAPKAHKEHRP